MNRQQKYRIKHKKAGICVDCPKPAMPGKILCHACSKRHRTKGLEMDPIRRIKRSIDKRCKRCGAPLDPDADGDFKTCINCRERTNYAKINI